MTYSYVNYLYVAIAILFFVVFVVGSVRISRYLRYLNSDIRRRAKLEAKNYATLRRDYEDAHAKLERQKGATRIIEIIHDISEEAVGRDNLRQHISFEEAFEIIEQTRSTNKSLDIEVILHTMGGYALPTEMIAAALMAHPGRKTAYVPYIAMSGGTIVALAADKIVMGANAALGPIDSQYAGFPADVFARLRKEKPVEEISDEVLMIAYVVEKSEKTARERACDLLNKNHQKRGQACGVTDWLMNGELHHSERITASRAKDLGINISEDFPERVYKVVDTRLRMLKRYSDKGPAHEEMAKAPIDIEIIKSHFRHAR